MFEEIEKRVAKIMYEWRLYCLAGDEVQAAYCRGMLTEVLFSMKSAEQSVQPTDGSLCKDCGHPVEIKQVAGCLNHPVSG